MISLNLAELRFWQDIYDRGFTDSCIDIQSHPSISITERHSMEGIEYIYELCEALPRSGPGDNESTRCAFNSIPQFETPPFILDIGCGQGMQTIELAKISNGKVVALDNHQAFLDMLMEQAKKHRVDERIIPKNTKQKQSPLKYDKFLIIARAEDQEHSMQY